MKQEKTPLYKIDNPTTLQLFNAILDNDYIPLEKLAPKHKQIKVLLMDYWTGSDILVTFTSVTNSGGCPIFFEESASLYDIASELNDNWYNLSQEEQDNDIELLGSYTRTYDSLFTNN